MITREVVVRSQSGFGSEKAAVFIHKASSYSSVIWIEKDERKANAKSLLGLLSLGIRKDEKINLIVEGEDEQKAAEELESYLCDESGYKV